MYKIGKNINLKIDLCVWISIIKNVNSKNNEGKIC